MVSPLVGSLAASISSGALAWVFLVQAPLLSRRWGRDRFVPLQMTLMKPLLTVTGVASVVMLATATDLVHRAIASGALVLTGVAAVLTPKALRAGGRSLHESLNAADSHSAARFLTDGGGRATKWLHRALGLSVIGVLSLQLVWPAVPVQTPPGLSVVARARHRANPETTDSVRRLSADIDLALAAEAPSGAATADRLQADFALIFSSCTMTGEAHEALHAFLEPIGEELRALAVADNVSATRAHLTRLQRLVGEYPLRFDEL